MNITTWRLITDYTTFSSMREAATYYGIKLPALSLYARSIIKIKENI